MRLTRLTLAVVTLFALGLNFAAFAGDAKVAARAASPLPNVLPPYLQNPSEDGVTICFLAQAAEEVRIEWRLIEQETDKNGVWTEQKAKSAGIPGTPWTIWKTRIAGLKPGSAVEYRVNHSERGKTEKGRVYPFHTLNTKADHFHAAFFNDVHNQVKTLEALTKLVKPSEYEISFLLGDMWTNPSPANGAEEVFRTMAEYIRLLNASEKPMVFVRGNHETIGRFADKLAYLFDMPDLTPTRKFIDQNWYFAFQAGPVWFLAVDGGDDFIKRYDLFQACRERQAEWIKGLLAQNAGADAPFRILLVHMPLYNDDMWNSEPCRQMWEPILKGTRIDLEISGHDHRPKVLPKGKTYDITFNGHYPDQQDPQNRKHYSYTTPWPIVIGGGPRLAGSDKGTVMLLSADRDTLEMQIRPLGETSNDTPSPQNRFRIERAQESKAGR